MTSPDLSPVSEEEQAIGKEITEFMAHEQQLHEQALKARTHIEELRSRLANEILRRLGFPVGSMVQYEFWYPPWKGGKMIERGKVLGGTCGYHDLDLSSVEIARCRKDGTVGLRTHTLWGDGILTMRRT